MLPFGSILIILKLYFVDMIAANIKPVSTTIDPDTKCPTTAKAPKQPEATAQNIVGLVCLNSIKRSCSNCKCFSNSGGVCMRRLQQFL